MSNYVKATNFTAKDSLPSGNSGKIVKGSEIDTELTAVASAISSKADTNSPALTGTPTAPTAAATTNTTQIATTAYVRTEITNLGTIGTMAAQNANAVAITGGSVAGITDLAVADGGTGASSITANSVILGNGSSALSGNLVAPGSNGNVLKSNGTTWTSAAPTVTSGLGLNGEVWNNVTSSRSFNTQYTNSRSYPIAVSARTTCSGGSSINFIVDGVSISNFNWQWNGCGSFGGGFVIVPPGKTYQLDSGQSVDYWRELY
jgi:hypothetical protein